jgi:hypothetical protein
VIEIATADDAPAVERVINAAYHAGEAGIWEEGWTRTDRAGVERMIAGPLLAGPADLVTYRKSLRAAPAT